MTFSLRMLRYVVATAECGSVTSAARELNVSQSSISTTIAAFEAQLGFQIFIRYHAKGVGSTPAGERVVNEARLLLNHARDFEQNAASLGGDLRGDIAVGSFLTLAIRFMPSLLARFSELYPNINVVLHEGDQRELLDMILSGKVELALGYGFAVPENITAEPLIELPPFAVVSARHRLADYKNVSLREFAHEPFVLLDLPYSREYFFGLFRSANINPSIVYRSRSQELITGLVAHGHGFTIQNAIPGTRFAYDGGRISLLALKENLTPTRVTCLWLKGHALRSPVAAFANFLRDELQSAKLRLPHHAHRQTKPT